MKFTLSWLKEHLETKATKNEIVDRLTMVGLEVERIVDRSAGLEKFVVAKIISAKQHPNADRLRVCEVDNGSSLLTVVCGAPNARAGIKAVFAPSGSFIPGTGITLKPTEIRKVLSTGMLLSERELGISDEHEGIVELSPSSIIGRSAAQAMKLDDTIIEIAITPNRGDCLGVRGIARDLAASGVGSLKPLSTKPVPGTFKSQISVKINFTPDTKDACPYFIGRYIRGVQNGESPDWLKEKLISIGLRPISALVDITNLMTFDLGRPLHVFDAAQIKGDLNISLATPQEKFLALNGKNYTLDDTMCAIRDDNEIKALGGIIGGEDSSCTSSTNDVFIECAYFDPIRTAKTGRKLQINSDARFRFERAVDPSFLANATEIATRLVLDLCGGEPSELVIAGAQPNWQRNIELRTSRVKSLAGIDIPTQEIERILLLLGFTVEGGNGILKVSTPPWRNDVTEEACLVEEVVRIFGFDKIPTVPVRPVNALPEVALDPLLRRTSSIRRILAARGLVEAVTYSFLSEEDAELFGPINENIRLINPISSDLSIMRSSILPNLINAAKFNAAHANSNIALFEIGPQFSGDSIDDERIVASGIRLEAIGERNWLQPIRPVDVFDAKADVLAVLNQIWGGALQLQIKSDAPSYFHPGRSGVLQLGPKNIIAYFGELHPEILQKINLAGPISAFEIFIENIPLPKLNKTTTRDHLSLPQFHKIERDFCFIVDKKIEAKQVFLAAFNADKKIIKNIKIFDIFEGDSLDPGKKSIAINVTIQPKDRSMTDKEINDVGLHIIESVNTATGGILRA